MSKTLLLGTFLAILVTLNGCSTATEPSNEQSIAQNAAPLPVTVTNFVTITNFVTQPTEQSNSVGQVIGTIPTVGGQGGLSENSPSNLTQQAATTESINPNMSPEDIAYLKRLGYTDWQIANASYVTNSNSTPQTGMSPTPPDLKGAIIYLNSFFGMTNQAVAGDVISMSPQALKFRPMGKDYDYSGNCTVILNTPRQHQNPYFGFGSPETANILILDDVGGQSFPLQNATIWEKKENFIDAVSYGKEWIYSGAYTIQN